MRVHVDAKGVTDAANTNILVKSIIVAVFGKDTHVPLTKRHLVIAGSVIRHIGI